MSSTVTVSGTPAFTKLKLRTAYGPVYRNVSTKSPREPKAGEIPVIDISAIDGDLAERKVLACIIKQAAENTGFFYISNHGIPDEVVANAQGAAEAFFKQPLEKKLKVSKSRSNHFNGYSARGTGKASETEGSKDNLIELINYILMRDSRLPRGVHVAIRSQIRSSI